MNDNREGPGTPPPAGDDVAAPGGAGGDETPAIEVPAPPEPAGPEGLGPRASAEEAAAVAPADDAAMLRDRWLRAEAELQNYRRRAVREREEARRGAEESVMLEIIAALDDLDRAVAAATQAGAPGPWLEGVKIVVSRLVDYLARQGVVVLDPLGLPFDPAFHEAILEAEVPGVEPGCVAQVVLKGWRRGDRALRAARVVVARAPQRSEKR